MTLLDFIWPALYIAGSVYKFWFLVFLTIVIEAFCIQFFLKIPLKKSILISSAGNLISGLIGTCFMAVFGILYHAIADSLFFTGTFNTFNWIASYLFMCFGSALIEIIAVRLIWKYEFKKLLFPLTIGNILSYILIIVLNNFNIFYNGVN